MNTIKKMILYTFLILFLLSIHRDLTVGTFLNSTPDQQNKLHIMEQEKMEVLKVQVGQGETVLSIVEEINEPHSSNLDIPQILADFKSLNHGVKPTDIKKEEYYYFPLYKNQ
ncbi:hypothetical protein [Lentibacillus amyloliquefaciens]|uniref:LysM domain-containing protein n=1 Tax=Lentibacillus amyloliquefaciens TaxID=1472767 RepID=A0A0U4FQH7_9BACI|nr:hypothetical protein [Lentibacillus amyloliquefaciens]ALX48101.1 hypothetical protein AOX59_05480 [Lentibacillus amyloliquefaciens]